MLVGKSSFEAMGGHWYGDDWYRLEYRPQPDLMVKVANVLREHETFRLEFLGEAKTEVVGEKGKIYAVTPTPPGTCSFQFLCPVIGSGAEVFREFWTCPRTNSQMVSGLWVKKRDMSGCRSSFNIEAAQQLEKLTYPFQCHHLGHRFEKRHVEKRGECHKEEAGRGKMLQQQSRTWPRYVRRDLCRDLSHLMPLEP